MSEFITHRLFSDEECDRLIAWLEPHVTPRSGDRGVAGRVDAACLDVALLRAQRLPEVAKLGEWLEYLCWQRNFLPTSVTFAALRYRVGDWMDGHSDDHLPGDRFLRGYGGTVQLSVPEDYEGGDLQLDDGTSAPRLRGLAVMTEFGTRHRVTEVTAGTRWALAGWITDERFFMRQSPTWLQDLADRAARMERIRANPGGEGFTARFDFR